MSKHNFVQSSEKFGEYTSIIYCTWCGLVVWDFNKNEKTDLKQSDLQKNVGKACNGE